MSGGAGGAAAGRRFVDLHTHSTASDGARAPEDVVAAAAAAGLAAIALTDHDTLAGVERARAAAAGGGALRVVAGAELSAVEGNREVHLLALHVERVDDLERALAVFRDARLERAAQMVERLNALGVPVTLDAVLAEAGSGAVGRPHVARALVAGKFVGDLREAFDRYLANGRPAHVEKHRLSLADAIRLAHDAGGIAVLAHPGPEGTRARIEELTRLGLDGVEVRHPGHSAEDTARLGALADHFGLVKSGGSDWHGGTAEGPRALGGMQIPGEWLEAQDERVARRRAALGA